MKSQFLGLAIALVPALASAVSAQYVAGYYVGGRGGSTPIGDYLIGSSEVIRSSGEAAKNRGQAAIYAERARGEYQKNKYEAAKIFWDRHLLWKERMADLRGRPLTAAQLHEFGGYFAPKRLSALELSPSSGQIQWPAVLLSPEFAQHRSQLEALFQPHSFSPSVNDAVVSEAVAELTSSLQKQLDLQIRQMSPNKYSQAKSFLRGLSLEAELRSRTEGVALR